MKKILLALFLFLSITAIRAQAPVTDTAAYLKEKTGFLKKMIHDLDNITLQAKGLSADIFRIPIGDTLKSGSWKAVRSGLIDLKKAERQLVHDSVKMHTFLSVTEVLGFQYQYSTLADARKQIESRNTDFQNDTAIYSAQQYYIDNAVSNLLQVTDGFRQYLNSLIPPKPDELLPAIVKQFSQTNDSVRENSRIDRLNDSTRRQIRRVKDSLDILDRKLDNVTALLRPGNSGRQYLLAGGYNDNVFGVAYLRRLTNADYLGAEFIFPVRSGDVTGAGAFLLYGLRDNKLLLQAGAGYLKTRLSRENISWKAALLYIPKNFGIGLGYSPLTGTGIQLAYRL